MRIEIPLVKRCCCCLPLRHGIILWIYLKLAATFILLLFFVEALVRSINKPKDDIFYFIVPITLIMMLVEIAFCVLFLVSAHRKHHRHMRIYYRYAICILVLEVFALLAYVGYEIYETHRLIRAEFSVEFILSYALYSTCFFFGQTIFQAYLVILVRSELLKLENNIRFEFTNNTTGVECKAEMIEKPHS